jgi:hypothetical protein
LTRAQTAMFEETRVAQSLFAELLAEQIAKLQ